MHLFVVIEEQIAVLKKEEENLKSYLTYTDEFQTLKEVIDIYISFCHCAQPQWLAVYISKSISSEDISVELLSTVFTLQP